MKTVFTVLLSCTLLLPAMLDAAPAPWYQWRSKANGGLVCSQTQLGPGWEKADGPYRDAHCEKSMHATHRQY